MVANIRGNLAQYARLGNVSVMVVTMIVKRILHAFFEDTVGLSNRAIVFGKLNVPGRLLCACLSSYGTSALRNMS